jgi:hypothetical protein
MNLKKILFSYVKNLCAKKTTAKGAVAVFEIQCGTVHKFRFHLKAGKWTDNCCEPILPYETVSRKRNSIS